MNETQLGKEGSKEIRREGREQGNIEYFLLFLIISVSLNHTLLFSLFTISYHCCAIYSFYVNPFVLSIIYYRFIIFSIAKLFICSTKCQKNNEYMM